MRKARLLLRQRNGRLNGLRDVGHIVAQHEINIVVLGFSSDTEPTRLEAWEEHANELAKTCWVQDGDAFRGTARGVVCVYSPPWDGTLALGTNLVDPRYNGQLRTRSCMASMPISQHFTYQSMAKTCRVRSEFGPLSLPCSSVATS